MQITPIHITYTNTSSTNEAEENDPRLQAYLQRVGWETGTYSNTKLKTMLAASCLRFLEGLTDIDFVVGLSNEIHRKYRETMKLSLWYSTEILCGVAEKLKNKRILPTDTVTINELVNDAQEVITKRRYLAASIV